MKDSTHRDYYRALRELLEHVYMRRTAFQRWSALIKSSLTTMSLLGSEDDVALCVALCWGALLRAPEALSLAPADVALAGDPGIADCGPGAAGVHVQTGNIGRCVSLGFFAY